MPPQTICAYLILCQFAPDLVYCFSTRLPLSQTRPSSSLPQHPLQHSNHRARPNLIGSCPHLLPTQFTRSPLSSCFLSSSRSRFPSTACSNSFHHRSSFPLSLPQLPPSVTSTHPPAQHYSSSKSSFTQIDHDPDPKMMSDFITNPSTLRSHLEPCLHLDCKLARFKIPLSHSDLLQPFLKISYLLSPCSQSIRHLDHSPTPSATLLAAMLATSFTTHLHLINC